jgi:methylated-DNA-[protein]-cysteine S-methyltransferase
VAWKGARDERGISDFQREVFAAVEEIPHGTTTTYGEIARRLGRAAAVRAVGTALHRNPFAIVIPCHRVLPESGGVGGYACGPDCKRRLLALEAGQTEFEWDAR